MREQACGAVTPKFNITVHRAYLIMPSFPVKVHGEQFIQLVHISSYGILYCYLLTIVDSTMNNR